MLPSGTIHIDTLLSGVLIGKTNEQYIADMVLPPIYSAKLTGKIAKMGDDHYRVDFASRALGAPGYMVNWSVSSEPFSIEEFRLEHPVDDLEAGMYDDPFDPRRDAQLVLWHKLMAKKESLVAGLVLDAAKYGASNKDTTNRSWDVAATGTPVTDVGGAINSIVAQSGVAPTRIYGACSYKVFNWLRLNNQVRNVYLNTSPNAGSIENINAAALARTLGLRELHVGPSIQITSKEGQTATKAYIWNDDDFLVYYKAEEPGIMIPNLGYGVYPRIPGLPGAQVVSDVYRREELTSDVVRSRMLLDSVIGDSTLGFLFTSVDAS